MLAAHLLAEAAILASARLAGTALRTEAAVLAATGLATAGAVARWPGYARVAVLAHLVLAVLAQLVLAELVLAELVLAVAVLAWAVMPKPSDGDLLHAARQRTDVGGARLTRAEVTAAVVGYPVLLKPRPLLDAGLPVSFLADVPAALAKASRGHVVSGGGRLLVLALRKLALSLLSLSLLSLSLLSLSLLSLRSHRRLSL